jgi:hypothetical protein
MGMLHRVCAATALLFTLSIPSSEARNQHPLGGDGVGNGGGLSEQNTELAWRLLPLLVSQCMALGPDCSGDPNSARLLKEISLGLTRYDPKQSYLRFVPSSEHPARLEPSRTNSR